MGKRIDFARTLSIGAAEGCSGESIPRPVGRKRGQRFSISIQPMMPKDIRFVAEHTVGKLAKWLRMLGFDTLYEREPSTGESPEPDRIRLTRNRRIRVNRRSSRILIIRSDHYIEQLDQVIRNVGLGLEDIHPFTRCLRCNAMLRPVPKIDVFGKVPDYVWETHERFQSCTNCGRTYWPGSHMEQGMRRIRKLFENVDSKI